MLPSYLKPQPYNSILDADSYKIPHWLLYRDGLKTVYSFLESRGGEHDQIMLAGVQPFLYEYLGQPVQDWEIEEAAEFSAKHFGTPAYFYRQMWDEIVNKHDRRLPLKVRAVPEGLLLPKKTPLLSIENTGSKITAPLTSYKETTALRNIWGASSVATRVFRMKQSIKPYYDETSDNGVSPFAVLDFMSRGVLGNDHSEIAGAAFLMFFQGSDNMLAVRHANYYYDHEMSGFSVLASEHSVASGWPRDDDAYIDHMIEKTPPGQIMSIVGDTWNIFEFVKKLTREDRQQKILNKDITPVPRNDSGKIDVDYREFLRLVAQGFGSQTNSKGYEVINFNAKGLNADGMNERTITKPFQIAKELKISSDSVMAGSGGGIGMGDLDRDTDRWAFKASEYCFEDGSRLDVFKDPITDPGKTSKKGRFAVMMNRESGLFEWHNRVNDAEDVADLMGVRFLDGHVIEHTNLDQLRERVDAQL